MKLLLTGSTGFVGRNFLLEAIKREQYEEIVLLVRNQEKLEAQLRDEGYSSLPRILRVVQAEAPDWGSERFEVDHVVHSAGILMASGEKEYIQTNTEGTLNLLRKLKHPQKIVILSSHSATGPCPPGTLSKNESDEDAPITWYGKSKLEMERQVRKTFPNLRCVFLRPPMILGARDSASLPLFVIGRQPLQVKPGLREKYYSFISVHDLVSAIFATLEDPTNWDDLKNRHFFVSATQPVSDRMLMNGAAQTFNKKGRVLPIPLPFVKVLSAIVESIPPLRKKVPNLSRDRAKEIWPDRWVVSPQAFEERFDWKAAQDIQSTLKDACDWYLKTGQLAPAQ